MDILKSYGKIVEVFWKTFEGTVIKTSEHTVVLHLENAGSGYTLPQSVEIEG